MPRPRQTQHRPAKENQDVKPAEFNELRKENQRLKREVARLKREIQKRAEYVEPLSSEPEPLVKPPVVVLHHCPNCNGVLKEIKLLTKLYRVCGECQFRKAV
jgi:predicted RNase H-like nuclease (RuvC/YqgF family)